VPGVVDVDEENLQHEREPEDRHRKAEEADRGEGVVEDRVLPDRRVDAHGDPEEDGDRLGDDDELRRVAHRARDVGPDRLQRDEGLAELLREDGLDPVEVANDHRLVQVVLVDEQLE
jgi:hypothetical protein